MNIVSIMDRLPHRYPFLLLDRVLEHEPGVSLLASKNVTANEPYFEGVPRRQMTMPGMMLLEAMAQASALCQIMCPSHQSTPTDVVYFVGIDSFRIRRPVQPGDQVLLKVVLGRKRNGVQRCLCDATVDGEQVATGALLATIRSV